MIFHTHAWDWGLGFDYVVTAYVKLPRYPQGLLGDGQVVGDKERLTRSQVDACVLCIGTPARASRRARLPRRTFLSMDMC